MPVATLDLNASDGVVSQPIIWRLGRLYNVVTHIRRARITEDYAYVQLDVEGSTGEVDQARGYLQGLGILKSGGDSVAAGSATASPENSVPQPETIIVGVSTVTPEQAAVPILYRLGKDLEVVVNILDGQIDEEEGGQLIISISGPLIEVQRAIAYLHTTGLSVKPRRRSVTDGGNL